MNGKKETEPRIQIDHGLNDFPNAPCPACGETHDVARRTMIGLSHEHGPRLCGSCIEKRLPQAGVALEWIHDLERMLEESHDPGQLAENLTKLIPVAVRALLVDIDWHLVPITDPVEDVSDLFGASRLGKDIGDLTAADLQAEGRRADAAVAEAGLVSDEAQRRLGIMLAAAERARAGEVSP